MKRIFSILTIVAAIAISWCGCDADVNLNDIDKDVKVDATLAFPVGTVRVTLGDFVGDGTWGIYIDSLDNKGVITFRDTFVATKSFHNVDLCSYVSKTSFEMNMYDQLGGTVVGIGSPIALEFPLSLKLSGINNDQSYQRLDSALIRNASFVSNVDRAGGMPIEWDWIEKISIELGDAFSREQGRTLDIYTKGDGYGYGKDIPINVDEFSLNLMKNKNLDPANPNDVDLYVGNVVDTCGFKVVVLVNVPQGVVLEVLPTATFRYNLDVQFMDYEAVWGMFKASGDMRDEREVSLASELGVWRLFESASLPFADPKLNIKITTQIAGALKLEGDYIYLKEKGKEPVYATFDGHKELYKTFNKNEYLGLKSEIGDSATMHILFDKDPARGHIDRLFAVRPDYFGYKFSVDFARSETPQIRITKNPNVRLAAECELPLVFNEGVSLAISDTIRNINLSVLALDSLLQNLPNVVDTLEDAELTLALQIENSIPLQFKAAFTCLDESGNVIIDPQTGEPLRLVGQDTLLISSPDYQFNLASSSWSATPMKTTLSVKVGKDKVDTLAKIKQIIFYASLDDESLADAYDKGHFNVKLTEQEGLGIKIGVGANLEAVLNVGSLME